MKHKYTKEEEERLNRESDAWDKGEIGDDPAFAARAPKELEDEIDAAMGLQPITLRLQKALIAELKGLAKENGLGYQPFVRMVLTQYVKEHKVTARA